MIDMFIIYDLIFLVFAFIYLPIYLFKKRFYRGLILRLGLLPKKLELDHPVWIHAVSVGEVMAVRGLWEELRKAYPGGKNVISTVTATGNRIAQSIAQAGDYITYLPLDVSFIVRKVINKINPCVFIIAETELWPNLISYLYKKNIPIIVVNGRISDSSFRGYLSIRFLLKPILNKVDMFCVQTSRDAQRLIRMGVLRDKIKVTGNMKFDLVDYTDLKKDYTDYRKKLSLESKDKLLVAASTHPGEEEIILNVYKRLLVDFTDLRLLIAPRHPERTTQIIGLIEKFGFGALRISSLNGQILRQAQDTSPKDTERSRSADKRTNGQTVFILDTIGQLISFYQIADIVFVGGSLVKIGGHNILEPASWGKPVLFGPYMFNFRDIAELFLVQKAAILVNNKEELRDKIEELLWKPSGAQQLGKEAQQLIFNNTGSTKRNLELIRAVIK